MHTYSQSVLSSMSFQISNRHRKSLTKRVLGFSFHNIHVCVLTRKPPKHLLHQSSSPPPHHKLKPTTMTPTQGHHAEATPPHSNFLETTTRSNDNNTLAVASTGPATNKKLVEERQRHLQKCRESQNATSSAAVVSHGLCRCAFASSR